MTREEHLAWAKRRALEEMNYTNKPESALISMMSDLRKHPELAGTLVNLTGMMLISGQIRTREEAIRFIEGFN